MPSRGLRRERVEPSHRDIDPRRAGKPRRLRGASSRSLCTRRCIARSQPRRLPRLPTSAGARPRPDRAVRARRSRRAEVWRTPRPLSSRRAEVTGLELAESAPPTPARRRPPPSPWTRPGAPPRLRVLRCWLPIRTQAAPSPLPGWVRHRTVSTRAQRSARSNRTRRARSRRWKRSVSIRPTTCILLEGLSLAPLVAELDARPQLGSSAPPPKRRPGARSYSRRSSAQRCAAQRAERVLNPHSRSAGGA